MSPLPEVRPGSGNVQSKRDWSLYSGSSITIGSVTSFRLEGDVPAYGVSKGGVLMLTRSLARDLAPDAASRENILGAMLRNG